MELFEASIKNLLYVCELAKVLTQERHFFGCDLNLMYLESKAKALDSTDSSYRINISTRRFCSRPASVLLLAIGLRSASPFITN